MMYYPPYNPQTFGMYNLPYQQPQQQTQQTAQSGIQFVLGEAAAKSANVAPGTSGLFLDSEKQKFYIKTVESSGIPMPLRVFNYTEVTQAAEQQAAPAANDLQQLFGKIEQLGAKVDALIDRVQPERKGVNADGEPAI